MARDDDDFLPKAKEPKLFPRKLEGVSVQEMREYIAELLREVEKVEGEIAKRGGVKAQAESLFK